MPDNSNVEVVLYIDDRLGVARREVLRRGLRTHAGIEDAYFTPGRPQLLVVGYDADTINSNDVLACVRKGQVNAKLIGGL